MQLIKKIFSSILILIGIAIMVALFGFAIMMIFHLSIFGYTYAKQNNIGTNYRYNSSVVSSMEIETDNADIVIMQASDINETAVSVVLIQDFQGVVKDDVKQYSYNVAVENGEETEYQANPVLKNGVLKIATKEPSGLIFRNKTHISITVPKSLVLDDLKIKTAADSVDIGNDHDFVVNNLSLINMNKSIFSKVALSDKLTINGTVNLETNYGRIIVNSKLKNDVNIKTTGGSIIFNQNVEGDVLIEGKNPYVEFGSVTEKVVNEIENSETENEYNKALEKVKAVNINGSLNILNCKDGNVKVGGTISGFVYINAPNVQFWANNVEDGITCDSGANNIRIFGSLCNNKPNKTCTIKNGEGHLYVNNSHAELVVYASKNGVNIKNAYNNVYVENKDWGTTVSFAKDVTGKTLEVLQEKGKIKATNLSGKTTLNALSSSVTAEFIDIKNDNLIKAKTGATVKVKDGKVYALTTKGKNKSASVDVRLGSKNYSDWKDKKVETIDGWSQRKDNINTTQEENLLNSLTVWLTDNGKIKISTF